MAHTHTARPTVIALSLALALALAPSTPAQADDLGQVATDSVLWDSIDSTTGILRGGTPQRFDPAHGGWRNRALDAIGQLGIESSPTPTTLLSHSFQAWNELTTVEQGGETTLALNALIVSDSVSRNLVEPDITVKGNSVRFDVHVEEFWAGSLTNRRLFFFTDLAADSHVRYEFFGPQALLATDSSGAHPAVLFHIGATSGDAYWGQRGNHQAAVTDGDDQPAVYVANISGGRTDLTVHAFIIDGDPCASEAMRSLASTIASDPSAYFGQSLDTPSACLAGNNWSALTSSVEPQVLTIEVDPAISTPDGSTRRFALGGQAEFMHTTVDDSNVPATISVALSNQAVAGDYPLTLTSWLETGSTRSQPMTQLVTLALREPEPVPEPEPEPEPIPEPEPVTEPVVQPEPEPVDIVESEVVEEPAAALAVSNESTRPRREGNDETELIVIAPSPLPVTPAMPPRVTDTTTEEEVSTTPNDPQYRLQESAPATPLPAPPQPEQAQPVSHEPAATLWSMWWLWVIVGLALIWWAWLGWYSKKNPSEGM